MKFLLGRAKCGIYDLLKLGNEKYDLLLKELQWVKTESNSRINKILDVCKAEKVSIEGNHSKSAQERDTEIAKFKDLVEYVEKKYKVILAEEETDRDAEVQVLLQESAGELQESRLRVNDLKRAQDTLERQKEKLRAERVEAVNAAEGAEWYIK